MGVVQVALAQTRSLLDEKSYCGGSRDGCQVWRGAQTSPCSARPKQPVHEPEPSAVHCTYIPAWCSASGSLFHPRNETNAPVLTWATKASGSAGKTHFGLLPEKTKSYTSQKHILKAVSFITNPLSSSTSCHDHMCLSTLHECLRIICINYITIRHSAVRPQQLKYINGWWPEHQMHYHQDWTSVFEWFPWTK